MAHSLTIFTAMDTYYIKTHEEALRKAKQAGKQQDCEFRGITLPDGSKGFNVYRKGTLVERYVVIKPKK